MLRRWLIAFVTGGLLGAAAGFGAGIYVFPFLFPPPPASEQVAGRAAKAVVARGSFIHADPDDRAHWGKGGVTVLRDAAAAEDLVFLEPDFEVGPGPKYHVYLVDRADIRTKADFQAAQGLDLGGLRSFRGSQVYAVPRGTDIAAYRSVVIWCQAFDVLIAPATLAR